MQRNYQYYKQTFSESNYPLCFLDRDLLKENITQVKARISNSKTIRVASKSIRSVEVLKMIMESDTSVFKGVMCFSMAEAVFLSQKGFDDLLVAYPSMQEKAIADVCLEIQKGKKIVLIVDAKLHVDVVQRVAKKTNTIVPICLDIDMSSDFPGLHFGVWRSSLFNKNQVVELVDYIQKNDNVKLEGVMGYEAQLAGVGDNMPGQALKNKIIQWLKKISQKEKHQEQKRPL
jgi:D-serine deaminase-like pyridoxal phosphate-dependent protein